MHLLITGQLQKVWEVPLDVNQDPGQRCVGEPFCHRNSGTKDVVSLNDRSYQTR